MKAVKEYNNFFVGVPLPEEYLEEYRDIISTIGDIDSKISVTKTKHPHMTVLFMGKQDLEVIAEVKQFVIDNRDILKECRVSISRFGYFDNTRYDVIHLPADVCTDLKKFHGSLVKKFSHVLKSKKKNFSPHITLARIKNKKGGRPVNLEEVAKKLPEVSWEFRIEQVKLYGRDPDEKNQQFALETIDIN